MSKVLIPSLEVHLAGDGGRSFTVDVAADGDGLVSHVGAALLAEVADRVGLTRELSQALEGVRERRGRHDPGRVIRDLAVMLGDGGDCLSDLRAVRDQEPLFGPVASDSTAFRLIDRIAEEPGLLAAVRTARARARERAWELGVRPERIVIDIDATLINAWPRTPDLALVRPPWGHCKRPRRTRTPRRKELR